MLTFRATTAAELEKIDLWVVDAGSTRPFRRSRPPARSGCRSSNRPTSTTVGLHVERLDVELEVVPEVVAWRRKRLWQIGPLNFETGG